jgi:predicted transcriptional regulator
MARKTITTSIETDLVKRLKYLAADTDRALNDLLEEAIKLLFDKYEKKNK